MKKLTVFAQRLQKVMQENNLNQKQLAKKVGVQPATISAYLKNTDSSDTKGKNPSLSIAISIAKEFNVSLDWLCGLESGNGTNIEEQDSKFISLRTILKQIIFIYKALGHDICSTKEVWDEEALPFEPSAIKIASIRFVNCKVVGFLENYVKLAELNSQGVLSNELFDAGVNGILDKYKNDVLSLYDNSIYDSLTRAKLHAGIIDFDDFEEVKTDDGETTL